MLQFASHAHHRWGQNFASESALTMYFSVLLRLIFCRKVPVVSVVSVGTDAFLVVSLLWLVWLVYVPVRF